ncbi:hypothetical protein [Sphingomonas sp. HDW15A]|uniref:hypothetical protein n=1 Tax=Sphingomonas sp. HDW15A TaxID=2714942 RepID=UPI001F0F0B8C|nr:hypothetical protein [Sphingomonas sp. HDW15A]
MFTGEQRPVEVFAERSIKPTIEHSDLAKERTPHHHWREPEFISGLCSRLDQKITGRGPKPYAPSIPVDKLQTAADDAAIGISVEHCNLTFEPVTSAAVVSILLGYKLSPRLCNQHILIADKPKRRGVTKVANSGVSRKRCNEVGSSVG